MPHTRMQMPRVCIVSVPLSVSADNGIGSEAWARSRHTLHKVAIAEREREKKLKNCLIEAANYMANGSASNVIKYI